jgi:hypothetical protein
MIQMNTMAQGINACYRCSIYNEDVIVFINKEISDGL